VKIVAGKYTTGQFIFQHIVRAFTKPTTLPIPGDKIVIDTPTLFGSTGIGELGMSLKPAKDLPLS
jgi:hypothetical protein